MEGNYNNLFNYKILYSKKRKRTVGFKITDNILIITSPMKVSKNFLMELIEKRKYWTIEKIEKKKTKRELIKDNKILFLGNEVVIKLNENKLLTNGGYCEFLNDALTVNITLNYNDKTLNETITNWYKNECVKIITERVKFYSELYNFKYEKISIKEQKTVWGTCNSKNNLTFNWKILMFNLSVIDYLVVHELVHTIHKNHSIEYWKAVENILPNYKELNKQLKIN